MWHCLHQCLLMTKIYDTIGHNRAKMNWQTNHIKFYSVSSLQLIGPRRIWLQSQISKFQTHFNDKYLKYFLWIFYQVNATTPHWSLVNSGSGNGLVPSGNKPLPEPCWPRSLSPYDVTSPQWVKDVHQSQRQSWDIILECQIEGQPCLFIFHFLPTWPKLIWPYPFIFSGVIWQPVQSLSLRDQLKP